MRTLIFLLTLLLAACSTTKHVCPKNQPKTTYKNPPKETVVITDTDTVYVTTTKRNRKWSLNTHDEQLSYAIGLKHAEELSDGLVPLNTALIAQAINDQSSQKNILLSDHQADSLYKIYIHLRDSLIDENNGADADKHLERGQEFLSSNSKQEGVVSLESGLQYTVIRKGAGPKPSINNKVTCHYKGFSIEGTLFDSTYESDTPFTFPLAGAISGWKETLQLMSVGSKWKLFIPPHLAYGSEGAGSKIPPHSVLIFELELLSIQ